MRQFILASVLILVSACDRTYINNPNGPSNTATNGTTAANSNVIEFRVNGNPILAKINFSDPVDGLTIVNTVLPYDISINTTQTSMFLSISATPTGYQGVSIIPFLQVQIFVNSVLFREANSSDFSLASLSVSGTWRK